YGAVGTTPAPFFELNADQATAFQTVREALDRSAYRAFLLEGVTGSGKTEIYLHAVRETLAAGRDCLVLVPEIALTAAIVERFRSRFGDQVAVLHSGLSEGERFDEWSRVHGGRARIVIGARSAVFAPLRRLGLVVVDEEHDASYKQDEAPRYHGRDAALLRAYRAGAVALLGSATPSLEATHNVAQGKLERIVLPARISQRPLPQVRIVGMHRTPRQPGSIMFSRQLVEALRETLLAGDQAILFLNRRGYAQLAHCTACKAPVLCAQCSISMTYHHVERRLQCHRCDYTRPLPVRCPQCAAQAMEIVGIGTERIEQEVGVIFPQARVLRVDSDTLRRRGELERMLRGIRERAYDVIIGTQILSKGHDFPHITLVGAVLADVSLNLPDFRAAERTFQILTQMAGRAGRGERPGRVLIQTYSERHYALVHVADHDSASFNAQELELRRDTNSPPWSSQVLVWVSSPRFEKARALAGEAATALRRVSRPEVTLLGPAEAPIAKLHNRYRWMILLRAPSMARIQPMLHAVLAEGALKIGAKERIAVDVDPYNLL
ncbi:MAG: primosomal protein N', partial [Candidatus Lambdaproteobacteria bacterium]|nr:primosomal protein N' [Candidatus Lambdaproteobacteria bacterium]